MEHAASTFDVSMFESIDQSLSICTAQDVKDCQVIQRLLTTLSYYSRLIDSANESNDDHHIKFSNFMDTVYKHQIYDDFYHFSKCHQDAVESIMDLALTQYRFAECDLSTCKYSDRHYRLNEKYLDAIQHNDTEDQTKYFDINAEMMDSLHFNIFHIFSCGLRLKPNDNDEQKMDEESADASPYFDPLFSRMSKMVKKTQQDRNRFKRLGGNKYNISVANETVNIIDDENKDEMELIPEPLIDAKDELKMEYHDNSSSIWNCLFCSCCTSTNNEMVTAVPVNGTFLDHIYSKLLSVPSNNGNILISRLKEIIKVNGYDTESLDADMTIFKQTGTGNVSIEMQKASENIQSDWIMRSILETLEFAKS